MTHEEYRLIIKDDIARLGYSAVKYRYGWKTLKKYNLLSDLDFALFKAGRVKEIESKYKTAIY